MDRNELEKFKRQSGQPKKVIINGDEFEFHPLPVMYLPDVLYLNSELAQKKDISENKDVLKLEIDLLHKFVQKSYPELSVEDRDMFILRNLFILNPLMIELSLSGFDNFTDEQRVQIEKMKAQYGSDKKEE